MKLYKYTNVEIGKEIIKNGQIYLSQPKVFNDPFDSLPSYSIEERDKAIEVIKGYLIEKTLLEIVEIHKDSIKNLRDRLMVKYTLGSIIFTNDFCVNTWLRTTPF